MPRGDKDKYTDKQKRKAEHIEESYESRGVPKDEAEARAWATVNKQSGGGERSGGSGQNKSAPAKAAARRSSAKRAVATKQGVPRPDQPLESMTKAELLNRARTRHIAGRSSMRKQQLIEALRSAA
ncbi:MULTISPECIES: Rho termination factor N-terminal domain-containing protein [unclassified Pseudomonas]|uniref:Rho termination factor N-terminal domain-containing protein n=1 Tax=unclassified Pseudomonas TaxID=196821 RepID=UPI0009D91E8C|nr:MULTISPECIES: Rho termination factor N-terminal domain-containing protein [unclassified Pseudomonas]MBD9515845.1 Rho termination factor N-terminal domain-containing protein [Pseudomonas sp. PDM22]MBD9629557.1 Rho termination factor N-terminal domain-containing protein [Pseudomonas sp. PDM19]OQR30024.1 termination factor Rho [Pseudomonas sp. T]